MSRRHVYDINTPWRPDKALFPREPKIASLARLNTGRLLRLEYNLGRGLRLPPVRRFRRHGGHAGGWIVQTWDLYHLPRRGGVGQEDPLRGRGGREFGGRGH